MNENLNSLIRTIERSFIGYDALANHLLNMSRGTAFAGADNCPPYNIVKISESDYAIEMALAGYSVDDIDVQIEKSRLTIKSLNGTPEPTGEYLFRGLAGRAFTKSFTLASNVVVRDAKMSDGILRIVLEKITPESEKPRKIEINATRQTPIPQYINAPTMLTETERSMIVDKLM